MSHPVVDVDATLFEADLSSEQVRMALTNSGGKLPTAPDRDAHSTQLQIVLHAGFIL